MNQIDDPFKNFIGFMNNHHFMYNEGHLPYFLKGFAFVFAKYF